MTARQWNEFNHDIKAIVTYANGGKLDAASSSLFTEAHVVIDALLQSCMTLRHKVANGTYIFDNNFALGEGFDL